MKKGLGCIIAIVVVIAIVAIAAFTMGPKFYNTGISLQENATKQWGNVESSYQRRADLIPNIVKTAEGYAEFEQSTLTQVIEARSKATGITIDPTNVTPAQMEQFQAAQSNLTGALSRLLVTVERYPDLKANENFKELINELSRTENRINVERNRYNESINPFNKHIKTFPNNIINNFVGKFEPMVYYKADEGSKDAPDVEFNFGKDKK